MFASGYDIRTFEGVGELVGSINAVFAPETVKLVHANDSKAGVWFSQGPPRTSRAGRDRN